VNVNGTARPSYLQQSGQLMRESSEPTTRSAVVSAMRAASSPGASTVLPAQPIPTVDDACSATQKCCDPTLQCIGGYCAQIIK
jgi:hypothetical protein